MVLKGIAYYKKLSERIKQKLQETENRGMHLDDLMHEFTSVEGADCNDDDIEDAVLILEGEKVVQRDDTSNPGETYIRLI